MYTLDTIPATDPFRFAALSGAMLAALRGTPPASAAAVGTGEAIDDAGFARQRERIETAVAKEVWALMADPKRPMATVENLLGEAERLADANLSREGGSALRDFVAARWWLLGTQARFARRNAVQAVRYFDRAVAVMEPAPAEACMNIMAVHVALADTLRFASGDPRRAAREYARVLEWAPGAFAGQGEAGATLAAALKGWLEAEINFITHGRRYTSTPDAQALAATDVLMAAPPREAPWVHPDVVAQGTALRSRTAGSLERATFATQLERLPPSQFHLLACFDFLPMLGTPERVARFVRRHDPAGFLSACLFTRQRAVDKAVAEGRAPAGATGMDAFTWQREDRAVMQRAAKILAGPAHAALANAALH